MSVRSLLKRNVLVYVHALVPCTCTLDVPTSCAHALKTANICYVASRHTFNGILHNASVFDSCVGTGPGSPHTSWLGSKTGYNLYINACEYRSHNSLCNNV